MCIGKSHALAGQFVQIGRFDASVGVVNGKVAVAQVIGKDVDDVGGSRFL